jgi:signal transduction histidine kinase
LQNIEKYCEDELVVATTVDEHSSETLLTVVAQAPLNRDRVRGIFAKGPISSSKEIDAEAVRSRWGHADDASPLIRSILQACNLQYFTALLIIKGGKGAYSLTLAANAVDLMSDEVGQVMTGFSDDLSFALDAMAETQRRREVEVALRESRRRLRELSLFRQTMMEQERKRISRELHDELGQTLTAIKLGLGWMRDRKAASGGDLLAKVHELMSMVDTAVVELRRIASDLRPLMLDELGLVAAIEWLASSFAERNGISVTLSLAPLKTELPPDISTAAFRIVQEALTNVVRHAKASRVVITALERDGMLTVAISDNGQGFKPQSSSRKAAFGILGMQERTQMLGGTFQICGNVGQGTTVQVRLPATSQSTSNFEHDRFADRG